MLQIMSVFEHSIRLELAISALEQEGIAKQKIFAVPLTNRKAQRRLMDTMHHSDGISLFSTGAALATAFAVIGASIGFSLTWGPIFWGLIGSSSGFVLGFLIDLSLNLTIGHHRRITRGKCAQVILVIECEEQKADAVEHVLWHYFALGVARVKPRPTN